MKLELSKNLREHEPLRKLVEDSVPILESEIGPSADRVTAHWDVTTDEVNRSRLTLKLTDWLGEASAELTPDELQRPEHLAKRFYRLWGSILDIALKRQMHILETARSQIEVSH